MNDDMKTNYKSLEKALLIFDNTPFRQHLEDFIHGVHKRFENGTINMLSMFLTIDDYNMSSKFTYSRDEVTEKVLKGLIDVRFGLYLGGEYDFKVNILKLDNDHVRVFIDVVRLNDRVIVSDESVPKKVANLIWELENTKWFIGEVMEHLDVYGVNSVDMSLYVLRDDSNQHIFGLLDGTQGQEEFNQIGDILNHKIREEYGDGYDYRIMVSSKWDNGFSLRVWVERLITTDFRQVL